MAALASEDADDALPAADGGVDADPGAEAGAGGVVLWRRTFEINPPFAYEVDVFVAPPPDPFPIDRVAQRALSRAFQLCVVAVALLLALKLARRAFLPRQRRRLERPWAWGRRERFRRRPMSAAGGGAEDQPESPRSAAGEGTRPSLEPSGPPVKQLDEGAGDLSDGIEHPPAFDPYTPEPDVDAGGPHRGVRRLPMTELPASADRPSPFAHFPHSSRAAPLRGGGPVGGT